MLDATPGTVRAGLDGEDHPAELIEAIKKMHPTVKYFSAPLYIDCLLLLFLSFYICKLVFSFHSLLFGKFRFPIFGVTIKVPHIE